MTNGFDWSILLQIPLVAAFIWYSIEMQKHYQEAMNTMQASNRESMEKRDEAYLNALNRIADDVKDNTKVIGKMLDTFKK